MGPAAWAGAWHCYQGKHRDRGQVTRRQVLSTWLLVIGYTVLSRLEIGRFLSVQKINIHAACLCIKRQLQPTALRTNL